MQRTEIKSTVLDIIVSLRMNITVSDLINTSSETEKLNLRDDLGLDSFDAMELIIKCEENFDIEWPNDQLDVKTVGDVIDVVEKLCW